MSFTCPRCNMTSHHPVDERHGYCGHCHDYTGHEQPMVTKTGKVLTDEDIQALADEAERGYDVERIKGV